MSPRCRVCWEDGALCRLKCSCKGDMALIHRTCFQHWVRTSKQGSVCDVCHTQLYERSRATAEEDSLKWDMLSPAGQLARISFMFFMYYFIVLSGIALKWCILVLYFGAHIHAETGEDLRLTAVFVCFILVGAFTGLMRCQQRIFAYESKARSNPALNTDDILLPLDSDAIKCGQ